VTGAFGRVDRHPDWLTSPGLLAPRASRTACSRWRESSRSRWVLLDLGASAELDVESADMLAEVADALAAQGSELRLAGLRLPVLELLRRSGLLERVRVEPTLEGALR
jgi:MFS superfamily sulfate permease-like transporter